MPGHVKTGGPKEADPDPSEFLLVSFEMKKEDSLKPYDPKKSVWVPDGEGGYDEALIDSVDGDKVTVKVGWEPKTFKSAQVMQVNPPKMEKFDDVSNMTYLNEASVLWNLKSRYVAKLIYVRSFISMLSVPSPCSRPTPACSASSSTRISVTRFTPTVWSR